MKLLKVIVSFLNIVSLSGFGLSRRYFINSHAAVPTFFAYSQKNPPIDESNEDDTLLSVVHNNVSLYGKISEKSCFQLGMLLRKTELELSQKMEELENQQNQENQENEERMQIETPRINLHLQSYGGTLMPAFYICDLIQTMSFPVDTYIDGYVASAASIISVCGEKRYMTKNSLIMIHQLSGGISGKFNEMQDDLQNSETMMNLLQNIYINHTTIDSEILKKHLQQDIWWNSSTCLDLGLIDYII